jgi:hypothetical protein
MRRDAGKARAGEEEPIDRQRHREEHRQLGKRGGAQAEDPASGGRARRWNGLGGERRHLRTAT